MPHVEAHILDVLKKELQFLECGGYRDPDRWRASFIFEDSPTCIHPDRSKPQPCQQCPLMLFVPTSRKRTPIPCRHIPLNEEGFTLDSMYCWETTEEIETTVRQWLINTIAKLENVERGDKEPRSVGDLKPSSKTVTAGTIAMKVSPK